MILVIFDTGSNYSKDITFVISPNTDLFFAGASFGEASFMRFVFSATCVFTWPSRDGLFSSTVVLDVIALEFFT